MVEQHTATISLLMRAGRLRAALLPRDFKEPAWNMLLDLALNSDGYRPVSVTSLCLASGAPDTTALRYIALLERHGLIERRAHPSDRRSDLLRLTSEGAALVARYLGALDGPALARAA